MNKNNNLIKLSLIVPDKNNPRQEFDPVELAKLEESVRKLGIKTPLSVEEQDNGTYLLIDGERRYRVATKLGLKEVPITVLEKMSAVDRMVTRFHIQEQHAGWTTWEKANALKELSEQTGLPKSELASILGVSPSTVEEYNLINSITKRTATQITKRKLPFKWIVNIARISNGIAEEDVRSDVENALIEKIDDKLIITAVELKKYKIAIVKGGLPIIKKIISNKKYSPTQALEDVGAGNAIDLLNLGSAIGNINSIGERLLSQNRVIVSSRMHSSFARAKKILDKLVDLDIDEKE